MRSRTFPSLDSIELGLSSKSYLQKEIKKCQYKTTIGPQQSESKNVYLYLTKTYLDLKQILNTPKYVC